MFTGIVEELGEVKAIGGGKIIIAADKILADSQIGDSIAVNGVCLTVVENTGKEFSADVMPETLRRTSLAELKKGSVVNLERALTLSSRLGGHVVLGHVDGVGKIISLTREKNAVLMKIKAAAEILHYIVEKGSVALDGISLTVAEVTSSDFTVSLIPHSLEVTNLHTKKAGSLINIENDLMGKYVEKLLGGSDNKSKLTAGFLAENGFM